MSNLRNTLGVCLAALLFISAACQSPPPPSPAACEECWDLLRVEFDSHRAFTALYFTDAEHGLALGPDLLETTDGGATWRDIFRDEGMLFHSFAFVNPKVGWIVGSHANATYTRHEALILHTTDGGRNWQRQKVDIAPQKSAALAPYLHRISMCDEKTGWAVGRDVIVRTADAGETWEVRRRGDPEEDFIYSVFCAGPDRAWAVGRAGLILRTEDGGRSWTRQESHTGHHLLKVLFSGRDGWIVGHDSTLLRSEDGGETWAPQQTGFYGTLFDIHFNGSQGWIVASKGNILHTKDGGRTWQIQQTPARSHLQTLFFLDPQRGWAAGENLTLLRLAHPTAELHRPKGSLRGSAAHLTKSP